MEELGVLGKEERAGAMLCLMWAVGQGEALSIHAVWPGYNRELTMQK